MALSKIKTNSLSDDAVTAAKIATGTIVAADLAANSVDSSELVDGSIDASHIASSAVTNVKTNFQPGTTFKGDGSSTDGKITINCSANTHGVSIQSPAHSAAANYTLTLPVDDGTSNQVLKTDGSGNYSFDAQSVVELTELSSDELQLQSDLTLVSSNFNIIDYVIWNSDQGRYNFLTTTAKRDTTKYIYTQDYDSLNYQTLVDTVLTEIYGDIILIDNSEDVYREYTKYDSMDMDEALNASAWMDSRGKKLEGGARTFSVLIDGSTEKEFQASSVGQLLENIPDSDEFILFLEDTKEKGRQLEFSFLGDKGGDDHVSVRELLGEELIREEIVNVERNPGEIIDFVEETLRNCGTDEEDWWN